MRRYELMLLFRPDLEDDQLQAAVERVTRAIVNAGGSLSNHSGGSITWQVEHAICASQVPSSGMPAAWPTSSRLVPGSASASTRVPSLVMKATLMALIPAARRHY